MGVTLVMGASVHPNRYSFLAVNNLRAHGEKVYAFGKEAGRAEDVEITNELLKYDGVDTVSMYMNPYTQKDFYSYILSLEPGRVIFNPGSENPEFYRILEKHHIPYEEACTLVLLSTGQY